MKTKEVKYYDSDCSLVREKLMVRRIVFFGIARQATLCRSIENMEGESHR